MKGNKNDAILAGMLYGKMMTNEEIEAFVEIKKKIAVVPYYWLASFGSVAIKCLTIEDAEFIMNTGHFEYAIGNIIRAKNFNYAQVQSLASWAEREVMLAYVFQQLEIPQKNATDVLLAGGPEEMLRKSLVIDKGTTRMLAVNSTFERTFRMISGWVLFDENVYGERRIADLIVESGMSFLPSMEEVDIDPVWNEYVTTMLDILGESEAVVAEKVNRFMDILVREVYKK